MKAVAAAAIAVISLAACEELKPARPEAGLPPSPFSKLTGNVMKSPDSYVIDIGIKIVRDDETGCQYLVGYNGEGVTPRLRSDGTPWCGEGSN